MLHLGWIVDKSFEEDHICCWGTTVAWVVYSITSCRESCAFFFFLVWFKVAVEAAIRHIFHSVVWDLIFADEFDGVGSFYFVVFESLS